MEDGAVVAWETGRGMQLGTPGAMGPQVTERPVWVAVPGVGRGDRRESLWGGGVIHEPWLSPHKCVVWRELEGLPGSSNGNEIHSGKGAPQNTRSILLAYTGGRESEAEGMSGREGPASVAIDNPNASLENCWTSLSLYLSSPVGWG